MTQLNWGTVGERFYEAGTDRGVLYLPGVNGVSWNGLTAVKEAPSGGDPQPLYIDGFKYSNLSGAEEFEATIEAFSSPREFGVCDGTASLSNGLFITQQPRKQFGLSYRTRLGNDIAGLDHGYKIHLVYNALAAPSARDNATMSDSTTPLGLSWKITTMPPPLAFFKPSAHFVVDSTLTPSDILEELESILYGTDATTPRLITPAEIVKLFEPFVPFNVEAFEDGHYTAEGTAVELVEAGRFTMNDARVTDNGDGSFSIT